MQARGIGHVVVSAGGEGALFVLPGACLWAKPPAVALTTTVGAGDAMVAGLTAALARGLDPRRWRGYRRAAAAVSRPAGGLPALAEIERGRRHPCRISLSSAALPPQTTGRVP
ncbi:PfkB family carbohydrate kinase [Pseudoroseomonas cervicalis]|uniref:PfkB family carbohydrate kinase n=1 Tax=Teichococcus cervicalis TaxID=204525 RepID=UPI0035EF834A